MIKNNAKKLNSTGSILILVIVAVIAIAGLSVGMSQMSSISTLNQLEFNQANVARNLAYSGIEYAKGVALDYKNKSKTIDELVSNLNSGGNGNTSIYSLGNNVGSFTITAVKVDTTHLSVAVQGASSSGAFQAKYQLPKVTSLVYEISTPTPSDATKYVLFSENNDLKISGSNTEGSVYGINVTIDQVKLTGSVVSRGTATLNYNSKVTGSVCSSIDTVLYGSSDVSGDINAGRDVHLVDNNKVFGTIIAGRNVYFGDNGQGSNFTVDGDIHASGNVTTADSSVIKGSIYSKGTVNLVGSTTVKGNVYTSGTVTLGYSTVVKGNVFANGGITFTNQGTISGNASTANVIKVVWGSRIGGVASAASIDPVDYVSAGATIGSYAGLQTYTLKSPQSPTDCVKENDIKLTEFPPSSLEVSNQSPLQPIPWNSGVVSIAPGWYDLLDATGGESTLKFTSGTYYFGSLKTGYKTKFVFNINGGKDILIFVNGSVVINNQDAGVMVSVDNGTPKSMNSSDLKPLAANVYLENHGGDLELTWGSKWFGTLLTTKSLILGGDNTIIGAYATTGTGATVNWDAKITYVPSNYALKNW